MRSGWVVTLLLGTLALLPGPARAGEASASLEQVVVESANTPAEHAALAKYYRAKAAKARADASRHEAMAKTYAGGKLVQQLQAQEHCKKISTGDAAIADGYEALAKLHDEEARKK